MRHLAAKGLHTRKPLDKKTHIYNVALTREEFLTRESQKMVNALVADFGDLALAQFPEALEAAEQVDAQHIEHLRSLVESQKEPPDLEPKP